MKKLGKLGVSLIILMLLIFFGGRAFIIKSEFLEVDFLTGLNLIQNNQVQEVNGNLVAGYSLHNIKYIPMERVPDHVKDAFIATEDNRFYYHGAVDPIGLIRAVFVNLKSGEYTEGGSTISQQLAKNLYLSPEKSLRRKVLEVILATQLEKKYSKNDILEMYLNQIYFDRNCYGIENASLKFFGKSARELNLAEGAMLAGVPKNPGRYSPLRHYKEAKARQELVLKRMAEARLITEKEAKSASKVTINVQSFR